MVPVKVASDDEFRRLYDICSRVGVEENVEQRGGKIISRISTWGWNLQSINSCNISGRRKRSVTTILQGIYPGKSSAVSISIARLLTFHSQSSDGSL